MPVPKEVWKRSFPMAAEFIDRIPDGGRWDRFESMSWSKGRVAILGDVVHAMVPGLGHGCGTAVTDAVALAASLERASSIEEGLSDWERRQRPLIKHSNSGRGRPGP